MKKFFSAIKNMSQNRNKESLSEIMQCLKHQRSTIFVKKRDSIRLPPQIEDYEAIQGDFELYHRYESINSLDLLRGCNLDQNDYTSEMGLKYSSPLSKRNKSKVSLTWVLHDQTGLKVQNQRENRRIYEDYTYSNSLKMEQIYNGNKWESNSENRDVPLRIVGRQDLYNYNGYDDFAEKERYGRRHRRRKRREIRNTRRDESFGYEIEDIDCFLTKASLDKPGNIPVVVTCPSILYKTRTGNQEEQLLPLGTVVNAVFKKEQWVYAQTPHGDEGYILYAACLPLGILPESKRLNNNYQRVPCWESCTDIYPPPCGNLTDTDKTKYSRKSRSECGYVTKNEWLETKQTKSLCCEETFDSLYMTVTSTGTRNTIKNIDDSSIKRSPKTERHILLVVNEDFYSYDFNTLSVCCGDVVLLIEGAENGVDVDSEWFYVRRQDGREGFIPSRIAGHGYI